MKKHLGRVLCISAILCFAAIPGRPDSCIECHKELEGELLAPVQGYQNDVHQRFGLGCVSCHGGNPEADDLELAKDSSFKGAPSRVRIPDFCGRCHSDSSYMHSYNPGIRVDQLEIYWTSQHGHELQKGDTQVAVCTDCHGTHGILESTHPKSLVFPWNIPPMCAACHSSKEHMADYGIPTDQFEKYKESVHADALFEKKDLSAPVCNDCHGNHGAMPPEIASIAFVCRQCHPSTGELFSQSPHKEAYDSLGISECEACHGNHRIIRPSDKMLGTGEEAVCIQCHEPDSDPYKVAEAFKSRLDSYIERIDRIESMLETAENQGVEVSEQLFKLNEANTLLILLRNLTHSLNLDDFEEKIQEGDQILDEVLELGKAALDEARFRKRWLIVATLFIFFLAVGLYLKIRQLDKKPSS